MKEIIRKLKLQNHKPEVDSGDWDNVHKNLLLIAEYVITHCEIHGLYLLFTSIIREGISGVSVSKNHAEGRAFDISVKGWTLDQIHSLVDITNEKFQIGAIGLISKQEIEALYEPEERYSDGSLKKAAHIHFQVRA